MFSVGEVANEIVRARRKPDIGKDRRGPVAQRLLRPARAEGPEGRADWLLAELIRQRAHHIVQSREIGEQAKVLEGARDAKPYDGLRPLAGQPVLLEADLAAVGLQEAGDGVEHCRLARAVGTDEANDLARSD